MPTAANPRINVCLTLTRAMAHTRTVDEIYTMALDALEQGLGVVRSSVLLFDSDGVMRFKASRGLSETYRSLVGGHTPWAPDTMDPDPIVVSDVRDEPSLAAYLPALLAEGIAALAFIPLTTASGVMGKFMLYYASPHDPDAGEIQFACLIASQIAFGVERTRAEAHVRRNEERTRFALRAASMGTWEWNLSTQSVRWSEGLEEFHGLPPGTFDGTWSSYEREIHPDDRDRVIASIQRAITEGVTHEVEYRIVAPDGTVRWVEGTGRVEYENGKPARMTGVCMMVTRRKEAELSRLSSFEEAGRVKDEFLATLSHELRTPLNAILGWVQLVEGGRLSAERMHLAIGVIGRNARLQARLIEDILDVSRIITGKLEIEPQPVFLAGLIENVVSGQLPEAAARKITIAVDVPGDLPPIIADPRRLHQVLGNVLSNAIKFTPAGGRVQVHCGAAEDCIEIAVVDNGVGIAPEFLPYVFDRFRQGDSRSTRNHAGLGLGLAIARHLLDQHQGQIRAHSDGTGLGTTITIRLPIDPGLTGAGIAAAAAPDQDDSLRMEGSTVLVVDDQLDSRELLGMILEGRGARVVQCASAAAALEAMERVPVDLLIADIAMPEVDGHELIRRVRRFDATVAAVAVSAYARPEDRVRALASGFNGYCSKPVDSTMLLRTIREVLQGL